MTITGNTINGANWDAINCGNASGTITIGGNTAADGNEIYNAGGSGIMGRADADGITIKCNEIHTCFAGVTILDGCTGVTVNWNNIFGNTGWGVENRDANVVDATNNWWGDARGPTHAGNLGGTGDAVSDNVGYDPWLGAPVTGHKTETVAGSGTVDATNEADTLVNITGTDSVDVSVSQYESNPGSSGFSGDVGKYIDVMIDNATGVTELEIRMYYTDADIAGLAETTLRMNWWDGTSWVACSDSGVNTAAVNGYSGYIWARIRGDTIPSLADLTGTPFGGQGVPLGGGIVEGIVVGSGSTSLPFIIAGGLAAMLMLMAGGWYARRRRLLGR